MKTAKLLRMNPNLATDNYQIVIWSIISLLTAFIGSHIKRSSRLWHKLQNSNNICCCNIYY